MSEISSPSSLPFQVNRPQAHFGVNDRMQIMETPEKPSNTSFISDNPLIADGPSALIFSQSKTEKPLESAKGNQDNKKSLNYQSVGTKSKPLNITYYKDSTWLGILSIVIAYILTDMQKKPRAFKIGLFSIFIVVGFLVLMQSAIQISPLVFLKISENQIGDTDVILTPIPASNDSRLQDSSFNSNPLNSLRLLNGPFMEGLCDKVSEMMGCSPRWVLFGDAINEQTNEKLRVFVLAFDYLKEKSIGLGRNLIAPEISGNESYLTYSTVKSLGLGDNVRLKIDVINALISQGFFTIGNDSASNKTKEEQTQDLKDSIKGQLRNYLALTGANVTQNTTVNTDILKTNANDLSNFIKKSGLPMDVSVSKYPNLEKLIANNLNLPSNFFQNNVFDLNNFTDLLDSADSLPSNTTFSTNSTFEAFLDVIISALNLTDTFVIKANISNPQGKWTEALGNVLAFDYHYITTILVNSIFEALKQSPDPILKSLIPTTGFQTFIQNTVNSFDIRQYTVSENIVVKNRMKIYTDQNTIDGFFIDLTNKYFKLIGKDYPATANIPLATAVEGVLLIKSFLDSVFTSAVFILILLSMLLIYSLMLSNIDEKTYEFGMLRALGFRNSSLINLLLIQGLMYALPAMAFGFLFSYLVNNMVYFLLFDFASESSDYALHYTAIIIGFLLGILMPLISNIFPIFRALSKTLRDSLDLYHRVINIMAVRIMKLEKLGISFSQFINSLTLIIIGITTYYFAPLAFVQQNVALFLAIMNIVLIFLILGFTIFVNLFQTLFEKALLWLVLWGADRKLKPLIHKNMKAHDTRNAKTALMYTICIAFLIFAGTGFSLQTNVIENSLKLELGSDIVVEDETYGLDESSLRDYLANYMQKYPNNIDQYSFTSFPLDKMPAIDKPDFSPLSHYPSKSCNIMGVEQNYLQSGFEKYYLPTEYDSTVSYPTLSNELKDGFSSLFTLAGTDPISLSEDPFNITTNSDARPINASSGLNETLLMIIPEGARAGLAIDTNTPGVLLFGDRGYKVRIRNMARKVPGFGFKFSSYQTIVSKLWVAISMEQMEKLMKSEWRFNIDRQADITKFYETNPKNMSHGILKAKLMIRFKRPLDWLERTELSNGLRNYFLNDLTMLYDTQGLVDASQQAFYFINLFYLIVAVISIVLSFFLILVSFISNVKENSWEFGVLRAIGLNKFQMTRLYMYEAGVLTMASGILGTMVGIVVAVTLVMQFLLFTELPFEFLFPTDIFCVTFFLGFVTALGGSYYAVKEIRDKPIANITKGLI